ncbi:MAG TPA: polyprenyl synthetase family protein [Armatimonadota bacterium]|jgi:octaprenyl-diphosphate synthase
MSPKPDLGCIAGDLEAVETLLREQSASEVPLAQEICWYVHAAGGKRLRPALVLLAARACGCRDDEPRYLAAAAEMSHAATLLHDDVVDLADSRRGTPTVNSRWSNGAAVMAGDILLSKAFQLLVRRKQLQVLRLLSDTMLTMCRGELIQNLRRGDLSLQASAYYEVIQCKTADFLASCCRGGALLAHLYLKEGEEPEADDPWLARLSDYGMLLGMAFQITDDLLDFLGDERVTGKPRGADLREGKLTLPLILALEHAEPEERKLVESMVEGGVCDGPGLERVLALMRRTESFDRAERIAQRHLSQAKEALDPLEPSPYKQALLDLADSVLDRSR